MSAEVEMATEKRSTQLGADSKSITDAEQQPLEASLTKTTTFHDPVFGEIDPENGPNYRNVGWLRTSVLMMKTQIGIGALSIPGAFRVLGLVPGVIVLTGFGIITTWSDYMIGVFKTKHPEIYGIDDVGNLLFGRVGREIFQFAFQAYYILVAGSAMVTLSTSFNAIGNHSACTAVFIAIAAVISFIFASIPTLSKLSWLAMVGMVSILVSIFTLIISTGVQNRPAAAPQTGPWSSDYVIIGRGTFAEEMSAIATIIFAFSGTPAFIPIASEMKDIRDYNKAMFLCQTVVYVVYLVVGVVVYYYCGSYVSSPALGSAGPLMKRVCYGLALPGLIVTTMIVTHLPAKNLFVRALRGSRHLVANTRTHWLVWEGTVLFVVIIGYIIASAVPGFGALVSLIGALLGTFICIQPYGMMWLFDRWNSEKRSLLWIIGVCWSVAIIIIGFFCTAAGTYGAVEGIIELYRTSTSVAWSCADNSVS